MELQRALRVARRAGRRGMSLIEVMVVIAIILTLMGVLGYGVMSAFNDSKVDTTTLQMRKVAERISMYQLRKKKVPSSLNEVFQDEDPPKDSWNNEFKYSAQGNNDFELISYGADGQEGGSGTSADIKWSEVSKN